MAIKDEFARFIEDEGELEDFGEWAFGEDYQTYDHSLKFMKAWNKLHAEKYELKPDGAIEHDVPKMVELWRNQ